MDQCKYFKVCNLNADKGSNGENLCILHSTDENKDVKEFAKALETHRETRGDNFEHFVFPDHPCRNTGQENDTNIQYRICNKSRDDGQSRKKENRTEDIRDAQHPSP